VQEQRGIVAEQKRGNGESVKRGQGDKWGEVRELGSTRQTGKPEHPGIGKKENGGQEVKRGRIVHAATDQRRKAPSAKAKADHNRMKAGGCRDHQDNMDSKREMPSNGRTRADTTDRTARTWRTTGARDVGAAIQSARPIINRPIEAVQRPVLDRQLSTKAAIPVGETRPKTPMPTTKIETTATITATAPVSAHISTRRIGGSPPRTLDGI
jgi:hypothetical protein